MMSVLNKRNPLYCNNAAPVSRCYTLYSQYAGTHVYQWYDWCYQLIKSQFGVRRYAIKRTM